MPEYSLALLEFADARGDPEKCRFTGAVRPGECHFFTALYVEIHAFVNGFALISFVDLIKGEHPLP